MENFFPCCGKIAVVAGLLVLGWGCTTVNKSRLAIPTPAHWRTSASAFAPGFGPEKAVDGRIETWWRSGPEEPQWLAVDLTRPAMVCGFSLQWAEPHATAYSLWTSLDGQQWALSYKTEQGDGDWDQVVSEPALARYVKLIVEKGAQDNGAALRSLEIRDLTDQPCAWVDGNPAPEAAALLDGDPQTGWRWHTPAATVELDLRSVKPVGSLRVDWGPLGFASNIIAELSTNRQDWVSLGRLQARTGDFDVLLAEEVRSARYLRLSFSGASSPEGFEVAGITLRGGEGASRPWTRYELAAAKAPPGVYPAFFQQRRACWTVAAGIGRDDPESLLDDQGIFAPSLQAPTLSPLLMIQGQPFTARQAMQVEYRLADRVAPQPEMIWRLDSGLTLRIRARAQPGTPPMTAVEYRLSNEAPTNSTGRICWLIRPLRLTGGCGSANALMPIFKIRWGELSSGWQEVRINDEPLFALAAAKPPLSFGAAPFRDGDVAELFLRGEVPVTRSLTDENGLASAAWWQDFSLEPGEALTVVFWANARDPAASAPRRFPWPLPLNGPEHPPAEQFDRDWNAAATQWREKTGQWTFQIDRPAAVDCLRAQIGWLLGVRRLPAVDRGEDVDSIRLRVAALLRAGQTPEAREWVEQLRAAIQPDGRIPARYQANGMPLPASAPEHRHDAQGQFAFAVMEYYRHTLDSNFLQAMYPALYQAVEYLSKLQAGYEKTVWLLPEEERLLFEGLLPPSGARPDNPRPAHLYSDHYWALLAWKELRTAAARLGRDADATWADEQYRRWKTAVRRSLRERMDRMKGNWIPASAEEDRLDPAGVALLFWPCEETDLVQPHELQTSLDLFYEEFLECLQRGWKGAIRPDESPMLIPLASMGRGDYAREILYALLDRRQPKGWQIWPETTGAAPPPGTSPQMPDLRSAALYVIGLRGLAARESGKRLDLLSGAPPEWLQHGDGLQIYGLPTQFGTLDLSCRWKQDALVAEIGGGVRPPEGFRLWYPRQVRPERILLNGKLHSPNHPQWLDLPHNFRGTVQIYFPFTAPWPREP